MGEGAEGGDCEPGCGATPWPGEDAMGKEGVLNSGDDGNARVIGVLSVGRQTGLEDAAAPEIYVPVMQHQPEGAELVVRSGSAGGTLAGSVQSSAARGESRGAGVCAGAAGWDCGSCGFSAAVCASGAGNELCGAGAGAGFTGICRGDCVFGDATDAGDWDTHGAGRDDAAGADGCDGEDAQACCCGIAAGTVVSFLVARTMAALLFGTGAADPVAIWA